MAEINDLNITDASNTGRFPEKMPASDVNNSARALEGILARWHKDINGSLVSGGSSNAYTLSANRTISAYYDGLSLTFETNHANTGAATLNVDSVGAQAIVWPDGNALTAGDLPSGAKASVCYDNDNTRWMLVSPSGASGSRRLNSQDASNDATLDFTAFDASIYDAYLFEVSNLVPATDDVSLVLRTSTDGGSTYESGATDYRYNYGSRNDGQAANTWSTAGSSGGNAVIAAVNVGSDTNEDGVSGKVEIQGPHLVKRTQVIYHLNYFNSAGSWNTIVGGGARNAAADVDAFRFLFSSGNIESGTITMYGLKN